MKLLMLAVALLLCLHGSAPAQECLIGAFGDPEGTQGDCISPYEGEIFSIYVVMFVENTVAAAAYSMTYPTGPSGMFLQARFTGPSGNGLVIDELTGTNAALAECVIGFGGHPVLVDEYQLVVFPGFVGGYVEIGPNTSQHPQFPLYVTCNDLKRECSPDTPLVADAWGCGIPTERTSFSTIKYLFSN